MILIDTETLINYDAVIKDALGKTGQKTFDDQIDTAISDFNVENKDIIDYLGEDEKKLMMIYYCLAFVFNYLSMTPDDLFMAKAKYYGDKYKTMRQRLEAQGFDKDNDGEKDPFGTIDMRR